MRQAYESWRPNKNTKELLVLVLKVLEEFSGYTLTVRQLYYQMVSLGAIPNTIQWYRRLARILKRARMSGLIDWDSIEDRLRLPKEPNTFRDVAHLVNVAMNSFALDRWEGQADYVEIWIEKDALAGVIGEKATEWQVTLQVNRGYSSVTAMREAANRFIDARDEGKNCFLGYLGDLDPSGEDMVRDVEDRLYHFGASLTVEKLAIMSEDIETFSLPPQPVKLSDARAEQFMIAHGEDCVELDALRPDELHRRVEGFILDHLDVEAYDEIVRREDRQREKIGEALDDI